MSDKVSCWNIIYILEVERKNNTNNNNYLKKSFYKIKKIIKKI